MPTSGAGPLTRRGRVVRAALTAGESAASMSFEVALRMRDFADLQERLARGETIPAAEMRSKYFPLASDQDRIVAWLKGQGFTVTRADSDHLAVFARGTVAQVEQAMQVRFARVAVPSGQYTSAISAPSLPSEVAGPILGIHGLQPHLRHHRVSYARLRPAQPPSGNAPAPYSPSQIAGAYGAAGLSLTGSGETIAIFADAFPDSSDLDLFWQDTGIADSTSHVEEVNVGTGPVSPSSGSLQEATLDVEWASGLAPGATIRVYGADENDGASYDEEIDQVIADLPSQPTLHVFSISFGLNEDLIDQDYFSIQSQYMATLASAGVTVLAAAGDGGSNPDPSTGAYNAAAPLTVESPADDPNVTGVGGTTLDLSPAGAVNSESAWFSANEGGGGGGGISSVFSRPSWQTGAGVPAGSQRLCPDVAADADPSTGGIVYFENKEYTIGGTSLA
ncbi:MAG: S53 family peptidase, partial [Opitutaceae bacterium]